MTHTFLLSLFFITYSLGAYIAHSTIIPFALLKQDVLQFTQQQTNKLNHQVWFNNYNPFLDSARAGNFKPFAQKRIFPANSKIAFFGDLHGNSQGLQKILDYLKSKQLLNNQGIITDPNFYMIFLGDYVDRGAHGIQVIHTLLKLKHNNPERIFLIRGNHEDAHMNAHYGFLQELINNYGKQLTKPGSAISPKIFDFVFNMYHFMPAVFYAGIENQTGGIDYIQCCHGGLELGYNPQKFLSSNSEYHAIECLRTTEFQYLSVRLKKQLKNILPKDCDYIQDCSCPNTPTSPLCLGLMWADFDADNKDTRYTAGRDLVYGQDLTQYVLQRHSSEKAKVCAIFRAHQHYGTMLDNLTLNKGITTLFNNLVYTFLSVPLERTLFDVNSIGILHVGNSYQGSFLEHHVIEQ